jgi:hypothetical protein
MTTRSSKDQFNAQLGVRLVRSGDSVSGTDAGGAIGARQRRMTADKRLSLFNGGLPPLPNLTRMDKLPRVVKFAEPWYS